MKNWKEFKEELLKNNRIKTEYERLGISRKQTLWYAYSDDSPTFSSPESHFVAAVIVTLEINKRRLSRLPKRIRKHVVGKRLRNLPELKFQNSNERTRTRMLEMLANENVEIFALIINKGGRRVSDSPENKGITLGNVAALVLAKKRQVTLTPDREFVTRRSITTCLDTAEKVITNQSQGGFLSLREPVDSQSEPLIQIADFVAGAISHKYNRDNDRYYQIIENLITTEEIVNWVGLKRTYIKQQK